jgi:hypothetical protein|nr:MAG TPA: hypothetical protein [Bacteriophage sp.]
MNFYNLYMLNSGWTPYSNIDIAYLHDGKIVRDSGSAIDMITKYHNFRVVAFIMDNVTLEEVTETP